MRVLLFRMLCDTGGVSSSMLLLGRGLARRGIECEYWFCQPSSRLPEFTATGRATVGSLPALAKRLERGDFDVVQMTASDPAALVVSRLAGPARVIVSARGALSDIWHRNNCFAYTAISRGMAELNQPFTELEIEVVHNAIDVEAYAPPAEPDAGGGAPIVAFVGRTTAVEKDFPRFTRIARRLIDRGARVWIADPHAGRWEQFAGLPVEQLAAERWEPVPHESIADFYRAVAASNGVVLMTSRSEGFGNVAPEAAACGARVAAPDVMGLRDAVIDGETGMLYPATASDDEVADRIARWLASPHDMARCAEAARRAFSADAMVECYAAIYEREEQRLHAHDDRTKPTHDSDVPGVAHLVEHLGRQRRWRATVARQAAAELARDGRRLEALRVLADGFRAVPTQLLSATALRQLAHAGAGLVRPARRA
jgi:glycosyltransferase involved in cell wall biosynthesis